MKYHLTSHPLKSPFNFTLRLSTALVTVFITTHGWAMEEKEWDQFPMVSQKLAPQVIKVEEPFHNQITELVPEPDRNASTLKAINSLRINSKEEQLKFIEELNTISTAERAKDIEETEPFLHNIIYGHDKVLAAVKAIPHEERDDVLEKVKSLPFLQRIVRGEKLALLINAMRKVTQDERQEFLTILALLLEGVTFTDECVDIFDTMKETPKAELNEFWKKVAPFLQDVKYRRIDVIKKMKEIPPSEKPAFLADGAPSLKGNTNNLDQVKIIEHFISLSDDLPPEPQAGVLEAVPLASNFPKEVGLVSENVSSILGKAHETVERFLS